MFRNRVWDYMPEFTKALKRQLEGDQRRWGDTWKERPEEGQEERIWVILLGYFDQWRNGGVPIP